MLLAHLGFLLFVALGGFLAWRHRWVAGPHVVAVGWGLATVVVGVGCPLTYWEDPAPDGSGDQGLPRGFVDTYLTGVIYPTEHLLTAQLLDAGLVGVSRIGMARRGPAPAADHGLDRVSGGVTETTGAIPRPFLRRR